MGESTTKFVSYSRGKNSIRTDSVKIWCLPDVSKPTVRFERLNGQFQQLGFSDEEARTFVETFGPKPVPPEDVALQHLSGLSNAALSEFLQNLFVARSEKKQKRNGKHVPG